MGASSWALDCGIGWPRKVATQRGKHLYWRLRWMIEPDFGVVKEDVHNDAERPGDSAGWKSGLLSHVEGADRNFNDGLLRVANKLATDPDP